MVEKTKKGTHTTTSAQLLPLEFGGFCIDTPGIKSFGVWDLSLDEVEQYFPEIFTTGHECKYPDCSHMQEEGCAVMAAVERRDISPLRYNSYISLMLSISEGHMRR
jgi:ribosome biogenesis GTPase